MLLLCLAAVRVHACVCVYVCVRVGGYFGRVCLCVPVYVYMCVSYRDCYRDVL